MLQYQDGIMRCPCGAAEELDAPTGLRNIVDSLEDIDAQIRSFEMAHSRCPIVWHGGFGEPFTAQHPTARSLHRYAKQKRRP